LLAKIRVERTLLFWHHVLLEQLDPGVAALNPSRRGANLGGFQGGTHRFIEVSHRHGAKVAAIRLGREVFAHRFRDIAERLAWLSELGIDGFPVGF
jgi:hypothetical protein